METQLHLLLYSFVARRTSSLSRSRISNQQFSAPNAVPGKAHMTPGIKKMLFGSMGVSIIVGILAIVDVATGFPFGGQTVLDIMFVLSAGLVGYMGFDTYKELT